ncbi:TMEM175 family protein [Frateuria hangzhouensis]|uniref:TMEM175 family protein n=1 Tax=Frateuria hangzhouensis TaxID=2995589 RepID=UPI002260848B|nr:TMEM175 family protein [Frateuria sp. STR12]MCX7514542.1 TMEM175 family protein [Frateuria sp. STR12]
MSLTEQREGIEAGRLDMFVDGAFALTLTLLLIGGEDVPRSTAELLQTLGGIPAFAACFFHVTFFWHGHVRWRRRCPQPDPIGRWLSLLLVFFALIFVYPLQMVFAGVFNALSGGVLPSDFHFTGDPSGPRTLFACYGLAFACMAGTLTLLFRHAARRAARTGHSTFDARREMRVWSVPALVGLASAALALALPDSAPHWMWAVPGFMYSLLGLIGPVVNRFNRRYAGA